MERFFYRGKYFSIEWYFDSGNKSQALEYFEALDDEQKIEMAKLVQRIGDFGKIFNKQKFRHEGDKIYAFKPKPDRFLCFFFKGQKIVITNAFLKKQDKMPPKEKDKALEILKDYEKRVKEGTYYE